MSILSPGAFVHFTRKILLGGYESESIVLRFLLHVLDEYDIY